MKNLPLGLLCLASLLVLRPAARAQQIAPALREQATAATRTLAAFISLDDARQLPVRRLVQLRLSQEAEARTQYADNPAMLQHKLTAIGHGYTAQLRTILSPAQFKRLLGAAPGALPATVAAVQLPEPTPPALATAPTTAQKASVVRPAAAAAGRPAAAKSRPKVPIRPAAPITGTVRH